MGEIDKVCIAICLIFFAVVAIIKVDGQIEPPSIPGRCPFRSFPVFPPKSCNNINSNTDCGNGGSCYIEKGKTTGICCTPDPLRIPMSCPFRSFPVIPPKSCDNTNTDCGKDGSCHIEKGKATGICCRTITPIDKPVPPVVVCGTNCRKRCMHGYMKDHRGCSICECEPFRLFLPSPVNRFPIDPSACCPDRPVLPPFPPSRCPFRSFPVFPPKSCDNTNTDCGKDGSCHIEKGKTTGICCKTFTPIDPPNIPMRCPIRSIPVFPPKSCDNTNADCGKDGSCHIEKGKTTGTCCETITPIATCPMGEIPVLPRRSCRNVNDDCGKGGSCHVTNGKGMCCRRIGFNPIPTVTCPRGSISVFPRASCKSSRDDCGKDGYCHMANGEGTCCKKFDFNPIPIGRCPPMRPTIKCFRSVDQCKTDTDCRFGKCCPGPCGRMCAPSTSLPRLPE